MAKTNKNPSVFISYASKDDPAFVSKLANDLLLNGINTWYDKERMLSQGKGLAQELRDEVAIADRLILIVGPEASKSNYVQAEWRHAWNALKPVIPVIRLGNIANIPIELKHLHYISAQKDNNYNKVLKELIRNCSAPLPKVGRVISAPTPSPNHLKRPKPIADLKKMLMADTTGPVVITEQIAGASVMGIGGVGKTIIAAQFAFDPEVRRAFQDGIVWVTVGKGWNLYNLAVSTALRLGYKDAFKAITEDDALFNLQNHLYNRRCLVILDDIWDLQVAEAFSNCVGSKSRLLFTTRDRGIAVELTPSQHRLDLALLSIEEAKKLLSLMSEIHENDLPAIAVDIIHECGYLPLALAMVGALIKHRYKEWHEILYKLKSSQIDMFSRRIRGYSYESIYAAFAVSIDAMAEEYGPKYRQHYLQMGVFPNSHAIPIDLLPAIWSGMNSNENPKTIAATLVERSLATWVDDNYIVLHDLQADCCRWTIQEELPSLHRKIVNHYRNICDNNWHTSPNDGYFYECLLFHLKESGEINEVASLQADSRWLSARLNTTHDIGITGLNNIFFAQDNPHLKNWLTKVNTILIEGNPGTGKSTFATQILRRALLLNIKCKYISLEEKIETVLYRINNKSITEEDITNLLSVKSVHYEITYEKLLEICALEQYAVLVLDSITCFNKQLSVDECINFVHQIIKTNTLLIIISQCLKDDENQNSIAFRFLADITIELSSESLHGWHSRYLRIVKVRNHPIDRGKQPFDIKQEGGGGSNTSISITSFTDKSITIKLQKQTGENIFLT